MFRRYMLMGLTLFLLALPLQAGPKRSFGEFREIFIIFELNETDGDAEVVVFAKAFEGMDQFTLTDPSGRRVIDLSVTDREDIGHGQVKIESAEPSIAEVQSAFPEGMYQFDARTVGGERLFGTALLSHALLPAPAFSPAEVDVDAAAVRWTPVSGAAAYLIEIQNDDLGVNLTAKVTPDASSFEIPDGFLLAGHDYEIGVATVTPTGNVAVAESEFTTVQEADDDSDDSDDDSHGSDDDSDD